MMRKIETLNHGKPGVPIHNYIGRDLMERMAPFCLFDRFHGAVPHNQNGGWHPHSGIATFTYMLQGGLTHRDTNGMTGMIPEGGTQWLSAGKGLWHDGAFQVDTTGGVAGDLQLWLQLPPELESGEDYSHAIVVPEKIPTVGNAKVLIGEYKGVRSDFESPVDVIYLSVTLKADETWDFAPPTRYQRGFVFAPGIAGEDLQLAVAGSIVPPGVMGIFEDSSDAISIQAKSPIDAGAIKFVVALAEPAGYPQVTKRGSVHTSEDRLQISMRHLESARANTYE